MNKTKKMLLGLGTLALFLGISGAMVNSAYAFQGNPAVKGPNYSPERHATIQKAFETNDYALWKSLMPGKGKITEVINQDNFAKFAEAHRLAEKGDLAGAQKIRQELGLGSKDGNGKGQNKCNGFGKGRGIGNYINR